MEKSYKNTVVNISTEEVGFFMRYGEQRRAALRLSEEQETRGLVANIQEVNLRDARAFGQTLKEAVHLRN